jgi:hypothetical protein
VRNLLRSELLVLLALGLASSALAQEPAPTAEGSVTRPGPPPSREHFPYLHLGAAGVVDVVAHRAGAELSATYDVSRYVDLGLGVSLGESIGILTLAQFHVGLPHEALFRPFAQLRGEFHIASGGYGGGAWAGVEVELGAGRFKAGPALIVFAPREGYHSYAVLAVVGFELDLLGPRPSRD